MTEAVGSSETSVSHENRTLKNAKLAVMYVHKSVS